jgi:hypothetical protein
VFFSIYDVFHYNQRKRPGHPQDELDEYYNSVREGRKKRKQDRDEAHQRTADYLPEEEAEEKRGINWQMQKNKGLTPHRSKVNNPRVKHKVHMWFLQSVVQTSITRGREFLQKYFSRIPKSVVCAGADFELVLVF